MATTIKGIQTLYAQGRNEEVLKTVEEFLTTKPLEEESREALALRAWAYYRRKEFEKARQEAQESGNETALRCLASIAAYVDKDPQKVQEFMAELSPSPARDNTWVIYARLPQDDTPKEKILSLATAWMIPNPQSPRDTANLLNNTARWLIDKEANVEELVLAQGLMIAAIGLYGSGFSNLHHRAGAWYWISVIEEKLFGKMAAIPAIETSVSLWESQVAVDSTNQNFRVNLESAKRRLEDLKN